VETSFSYTKHLTLTPTDCMAGNHLALNDQGWH